MADVRSETDSLGEVLVPADRLWGAQTQRSLEYFSIGTDLMPREMVAAYATLKKSRGHRQPRRRTAGRRAAPPDRRRPATRSWPAGMRTCSRCTCG